MYLKINEKPRCPNPTMPTLLTLISDRYISKILD